MHCVQNANCINSESNFLFVTLGANVKHFRFYLRAKKLKIVTNRLEEIYLYLPKAKQTKKSWYNFPVIPILFKGDSTRLLYLEEIFIALDTRNEILCHWST